MDPSRDPFLRRQVLPQPMPLTANLASGQSYYTLESLEGASSLAFLKSAPPASLARRESLPLPSERDALLRLEAQKRALQAEREDLDARARLLAAERGALLRNLSAGSTDLPDQRVYGGGLQAVDSRSRIPLEGMQNPDIRGASLTDNARILSHVLNARPGAPFSDIRGLSYGLDVRSGDPLQLSSPSPVVGGVPSGATKHGRLSELLRSREPVVGPPFPPSANPMLARRDVGRIEVVDGVRGGRLLSNGAVVHSRPAEANKVKQAEQNKGASHSKSVAAQSAKPKVKPPAERSEGWCAVCKVDCHNIKGLTIHLNGKKHKGLVEQREGEAMVKQGSNARAATSSQAEKKRGSEGKLEGSESAKRIKASKPASAGVKANTAQAKAVDPPMAKPTTSKTPSARLVCKLCNISTTGTSNLESHMKGKRHAARVKELANPGS